MIHGQHRKNGSNYNISWYLASKISEDITEHFVHDIKLCIGCSNCIVRGEEKCPHKEQVAAIAKDVEEADILIINSPTYVMEMTGQLKNFFDHMAYRYLVHRPHKSMGAKVAVLISTAAGGGSKRVVNSLKNQMFWWGVGKCYTMNYSVYASDWDGVKPKIKLEIEKKSESIAKKIEKLTKVKRGLKGQVYFIVMKKLQRKMNNPIDIAHWEKNGWL